MTSQAGVKPSPTKFIPLCVPHIAGNEWKYVKDCLDTSWVSSVGSYVNKFEKMVADFSDSKHGVAAVSGTAALHTAMIVAGIEPNDEVLVSALTFIAPANAVRYCNAFPVFIDAEPKYWQMDPQRIKEFLENECQWSDGKLVNKTSHRRVKAIIPVHILGHPVDIDPILELARKYELVVIEDATESLGATYRDRKVGHLGDIACFSFNGNKVITTGGGGMIVTDNEAWATRAKYLTTQAKDDEVEYIHNSIGYNYRLTNIQAAIGCAQMEQLPAYIEKKRSIAQLYQAGLESIPGITTMPKAPWANTTYWLYTILVDESQYGADSRALLRRLAESQIQARPLWQPLHRSPAYAGSFAFGGEVADKINKLALSLPSSVGIEEDEVSFVIETISASHGRTN